MHQTPFQRELWLAAQAAHAAGDRADARILMKMIEAVDENQYDALQALAAALRTAYRDRVGRVPTQRQDDVTVRPADARSAGAARAADARD